MQSKRSLDDIIRSFDACCEILKRCLTKAAKKQNKKRNKQKNRREKLKSPVADLKNVGDRYGGAIAAALFLAEFVQVPLVHLDIAGPAFARKAHALGPEGGTGFGVRTILKVAEAL